MNKSYKKNNSQHHQGHKGNRQEQPVRDDFMFNKTSLLSSALSKLKSKNKNSVPKRIN